MAIRLDRAELSLLKSGNRLVLDALTISPILGLPNATERGFSPEAGAGAIGSNGAHKRGG
jgi:hypothetical protein